MNDTCFTVQQVIDPGHPALPGHFPGHPVVPGVVLLSHVAQAVRQQLGAQVRIVGLPVVKFVAPLPPGQAFEIQLAPTSPTSVRFTIRQEERLIASGKAQLLPPGAPV